MTHQYGSTPPTPTPPPLPYPSFRQQLASFGLCVNFGKMFDYVSKSQYVGDQREKFARLDDLDSRFSSPASGVSRNGCGFEGITRSNRAPTTPSKSFKNGIKKGSEGLRSIGRSLGFGVSRAVFPEDLKFRTAYIAPSSRVFGRGELVIDPAQIAKRYLHWYFIIDFLAVVPLPQYVPRIARILPLTSELKRTAGVIAETAWTGAAYYLLLYMLASHIVGAFWYLLSVERNDTCWQRACRKGNYTTNFLYCGNDHMDGYDKWRNALSSGIVSSTKFVSKYCYCLWWGLQNLSTLGQGLETSTYPGESIFSIALAIFGLILFALLIGNMQVEELSKYGSRCVGKDNWSAV
ncbi:hypothetical protein E3N88_28652 [Mikania micrantha]|uniref:Ion transport domain-containing protein n=1 Tax=Mikania micrantha TaxID=192012 RepID=A0A5N6N0M5_9ASTR|nr:hypothetical protein E3N88_28652 [Mikania micrantha]